MNKNIKINSRQLNHNLSSLDPNSDRFNFELWAGKVSQQMKLALKTRLTSLRRKV